MKNVIQFLKDLPADRKRITTIFCFSYFFILFSYGFMRPATSAIFYDFYTGADYSFATFIGVSFLYVMIWVNNFLQTKIGVHKLLILMATVSVALLTLSFFASYGGIKEFAYLIFAIKESYIVVLIHMTLAFSNSYYEKDEFRQMIGPIGAFGSIGGILGGTLSSKVATSFGTNYVFAIALISIMISAIIFYFTKDAKIKGAEQSKSITPIQAVRGIKKYVFLIGCVIALSQFVIFIADLQFNLVFERVITEKDARAAYMGRFYSFVDGFALIMQFTVLPFLLTRVEIKKIFFFVPLLFAILIFGGLSLGIGSLFIVGSVFIMMKGTDYSIFNAAKEIMYQPLFSVQKFGAKYITDMFVYRVAKAAIAFVMAQSFASHFNLNYMQFIFLSLWIVAVVLLFKEQERMKNL